MAGTTVLIGLGAYGSQVLTRIDQSLSDTRSVAMVRCDTAENVGPAVRDALDRLLEAGRDETDTRGRRLDLFLFAMATQGADDALRTATASLGRLVGERYAAMFDLGRPAEQRNAALHLLIWIPPLVDTDLARKAMSRLFQLESWAQSADPAGNLLARVWLLPQLTQEGIVLAPGMIASAAAFVLATLGSGMREQQEVQDLLAHPSPLSGRFGFLSVASLDVPEAAIRRYATLRAVYDGLQTLLHRAQGQRTIDADAGMAAIATLPYSHWVSPFEDKGATTARLRKLAANLSGASAGLPAVVTVGAFDDAAQIREAHAALFRAAVVDREMGAEDEQHVEGLLRELDQGEAGLVRGVHVGLRTLFDRKLRGEALRTLPEIEIGLRHLSAQLTDKDERNAGRLAEENSPPDPYRAEVERAVANLPASGVLRTAAMAVGLAVGFVVFTLVPGSGPTSGAAPGLLLPGTTLITTAAAAAQPFPWKDLVPWGTSVVIGLALAIGWAWGSAHYSREELRRFLSLRLEGVQALWARGGGGRRGRQADDQIELRRHRVRRVASAAVDDALQRLRCIQLAIGDARDQIRERLVAMSVQPTADARMDDLSRLGGDVDLLHGHLVPSDIVALWVRDSREIAGDDEWADRLLASGWTTSDAADDVPCADLMALEAAAAKQVSALARTPLLSGAPARRAAADAVAKFVRRAVAALAPAVRPLGQDGEPSGVAPRPTLVLAPRVAQDTLATALQESKFELRTLWVDQDLPRVVFVYAWEGLRVEEIGRGAGLIARPVPRSTEGST